MQLQPPAQPGEKLIGDGAAPGGQLLGPELLRSVPADEGDHIPGLDIGQGGDIHQQLVHAHPSRHGTESAADQHTPALLGQLAGQAVGVADGDHCKPGLLAGLEGQPIPGPLPGAQGAHRGHPGPEGEDGLQVQAALDRERELYTPYRAMPARAQAHGWGGRLRTP